MRIRRLLVSIVFTSVIVTSCGAPDIPIINTPTIPTGSPTRTPFLPLSGTPTSASATPTPTANPTETATVTATSTSTPSLVVKLMAVGDIMLARTIESQMEARGAGIVFSGVQPVLNSADILIGNLECALTNSTDQQQKTYTFAAPPESAKALALAGFDVLNQANNHAMDFGIQGLIDTQDTLRQFGIADLGAGTNSKEAHAPVIIERNGLRLAFLGYADVPDENGGFDAHSWISTDTQAGIAWADPEIIKIRGGCSQTHG